jgi:hypothetical protein
MTLSKKHFSIMTLGIMTLSLTSLSITATIVMPISIMAFAQLLNFGTEHMRSVQHYS